MAGNAEIVARPGEPKRNLAAGAHLLGLGEKRDGMLVLPDRPRDRAHPLIVMLHGAGAGAQTVLPLLEKTAREHDCALLLPDSRDYTWDVLLRGFGADVEFLNRALEKTFAACHIDSAKIALAGFSDGASYALTLGVTNGLFFRHVMAFSPGFMKPPRLEDAPRIFISHGIGDNVLPIGRCSRKLVPQLEEWGYDVTYEEFDGSHVVPDFIVERAMRWFLQGGGAGGSVERAHA